MDTPSSSAESLSEKKKSDYSFLIDPYRSLVGCRNLGQHVHWLINFPNEVFPLLGVALTLTVPNFLGVPLKGATIVYLIDRGQGTVETFDGLRGAIMRSLSTLGPETKFQVIFWETSGELLSPTAGPDRASPENIKQAGKVVADAIAFGASKIEKPLEKALAGKPDDICIATGKFGLDQAWADEVKKQVSGKGAKVHTFAFGRSDAAVVPKSIAAATGGTFREIDLATATKLADFAPASGN